MIQTMRGNWKWIEQTERNWLQRIFWTSG